MISRLIDYYARYHEAGSSMSTVWQTLFLKHQCTLHEALMAKDVPAVKDILDHVFTTQNVFGFCELGPGQNPFHQIEPLAQAIGVLPLRNPEQPVLLPQIPTEQLRAKVEKETGLPYDMYETIGIPGFMAERRAVYFAAWVSIGRFLGYVPDEVLEIGAGAGYFGMMMHQWYCGDTAHWRYKVIDLPLVSVIQAYTFAKVVGEQGVCLLGEEPDPKARVFLYPPDGGGRFTGSTGLDLILNCDSMPEMPPESANAHLDLITRTLSEDGIFYSLNHESPAIGQQRVYATAQGHPDLRLISRHPFLLRPGYVEEVYGLR